MEEKLNNLKLAIKINITTLVSVVAIIILSATFYYANNLALTTMHTNNASQVLMNSLTKKIQTDIQLMNHITIDNSIQENKNYKKEIASIYKELLDNLETLQANKYLQSDTKAQKVIYNIKQRIEGYKLIANGLRSDVQEDSEDGLYSILALSSASQKISHELEVLNEKISQILKNNVRALQTTLSQIKIAIALFMLVSIAFILYINKMIVRSIILRMEKLKEGMVSFFDLLAQKNDGVKHIVIDGNDEIAEIMKIIGNHMYIAEKVLEGERDQSERIKLKVKEGLKEITALNNEVEATQREIVFTMGSIAEERSKETGQHVQRVAEYSLILARLYGLSLEESILIKNASPMHDIGKIGIPDAILNKPGKFTDEEFEIMKTHSEIGYRMLQHSKKSILKAAAILAYQHHERWDGKGYPQGFKGDEIHIYGRITAIADVFDALGSERVYKKAWPLKKILQLFEEERGKQFDPYLVDLFLDNLEYFLAAKENIESDSGAPTLSRYIEDFERVPDKLSISKKT